MGMAAAPANGPHTTAANPFEIMTTAQLPKAVRPRIDYWTDVQRSSKNPKTCTQLLDQCRTAMAVGLFPFTGVDRNQSATPLLLGLLTGLALRLEQAHYQEICARRPVTDMESPF